MFTVPRPYPQEFRDDVSGSPATASPGCTLEQIAADFGIIRDAARTGWRQAADVEDGDQARHDRRGDRPSCARRKRRIRLLEQENEVLRRAAAYLSQANLPGKGSYPLVSELAADGIPVTVTCRVLKLARQPYYRWLADPVTDAELVEALPGERDVRRPPRRPRVRLPVPRRRGPRRRPRRCAERTVWRICSDNGWWSRVRQAQARQERQGRARRPTTTWCAGTSPPTAPNQLWLTDITEHRTDEGKLYLCAIKDVFSNRIVGYSID